MGVPFKIEENATKLCQHADEISDGFEGFEKRLELEFSPCLPSLNGCVEQGLRALTRSEIDEVLHFARCTIVSELSNTYFDSYVLSESSLFIYPHKVILKTCGTTRLLKAVPVLLKHACQLSLDIQSCKYTRGCFIFPKEQPYPHGSFCDEVEYLDQFFGNLGGGSKSCLMGDAANGQKWHIYIASAARDGPVFARSIYTLEMCMTQLGKKQAAQFYKEKCGTATEMTLNSGIRGLLPNSKICDFAFDPCGYSMNSVEGPALSTIHVTPEDGYSYASFETMGYGPADINLSLLVDKVLCCFRPSVVSVAVHVSSAVSKAESGSWGQCLTPYGYMCNHCSCEDLPGGSMVIFLTFQAKTFLAIQAGSIPVGKVFHADYYGSSIKSSFKKFALGVGWDSMVSALNLKQIGPTIKDMDGMLLDLIKRTGTEDAFYVTDIGVLLRLWEAWKLAMPRVHPFYAVKCNSDNVLLSLLASLGAGFDVASKAELETVLSLGVAGDRIIFANPCKLPSHISYAAAQDVHVTTFDSEAELYKIWKLNPDAEVVLRIRVSDVGARCPLGVKYGAEMEECEELLSVAKYLGLQVVGVAFHVGSGASDPLSFANGIEHARKVFDLAKLLGIGSLRLLDIGGGFVSDGGLGVNFSAAAASINSALDKHFPPCNNVTIIAEPGRFFAEGAFTLVTQIFGSRMRVRDGKKVAEYWINDGIYGSMNCLLYDHATLSVRGLSVCSGTAGDVLGKGCESTIFGPTCDGLDTIMQSICLPHLQVGDWLVFPRMGAYTKAAASSFNGFDISNISTVYVLSAE